MPSSDSDGDESQGSQEGWQENPEMNEAVPGTVLDPRAKKEPECSSSPGTVLPALEPWTLSRDRRASREVPVWVIWSSWYHTL